MSETEKDTKLGFAALMLVAGVLLIWQQVGHYFEKQELKQKLSELEMQQQVYRSGVIEGQLK